jgi:hypothetical protein
MEAVRSSETLISYHIRTDHGLNVSNLPCVCFRLQNAKEKIFGLKEDDATGECTELRISFFNLAGLLLGRLNQLKRSAGHESKGELHEKFGAKTHRKSAT